MPGTIDGLDWVLCRPVLGTHYQGGIESIERDIGTKVQVIIADDIDYKSYTSKQFATALFNDWRLGTSTKKKNGVLVLVLLNQKRVEIEIGTSLSPYMGRKWCKDLLQNETIPAFTANQYGEGLFNTIQGVVKRLREVDADVATRPPLEKWEKIAYVLSLSIYSFAFALPLVIQPYAEWHENRYPLGIDTICENCGGRDWKLPDGERLVVNTFKGPGGEREFEIEGDAWDIIEEATDIKDGAKRLPCYCVNCGKLKFKKEIIPQKGADLLESDDNVKEINGSIDNRGSSEISRGSLFSSASLIIYYAIRVSIESSSGEGAGANWH